MYILVYIFVYIFIPKLIYIMQQAILTLLSSNRCNFLVNVTLRPLLLLLGIITQGSIIIKMSNVVLCDFANGEFKYIPGIVIFVPRPDGHTSDLGIKLYFKAYDLFLQPIFHCDAKPLALGPGVGLDPPKPQFFVGIPTCWYLKARTFVLPPTPNLKFAFPPT